MRVEVIITVTNSENSNGTYSFSTAAGDLLESKYLIESLNDDYYDQKTNEEIKKLSEDFSAEVDKLRKEDEV